MKTAAYQPCKVFEKLAGLIRSSFHSVLGLIISLFAKIVQIDFVNLN
jgi:hypothetical protein